jgi:tRNA-dihydrouridine synthase
LRPLLRIPLIANGNIRSFDDAQTNLAITGAEGVMSAEAILACPRLFSPDAHVRQASCTEMAREYLHFCSLYPPPPLHWMADHVHNIVRAPIEQNRWMDLRARLKAVGRERPHAEGLGAPPVAVAAATAGDGGASVQQAAAARAQEYAQGVVTMEAVLVELEQRLVLLQQQGGPAAARALAKLQRAQQREAAATEDDEAVGSLWFSDAAVSSAV